MAAIIQGLIPEELITRGFTAEAVIKSCVEDFKSMIENNEDITPEQRVMLTEARRRGKNRQAARLSRMMRAPFSDLEKQLDCLLNTRYHNLRADCEANLRRLNADHQRVMEEGTEDEKRIHITALKHVKNMVEVRLKGYERKVPGLKVLSAVAVCKTFKNSEMKTYEIENLGPRGVTIYRGGCGFFQCPYWDSHSGGSCLGQPRTQSDEEINRKCGWCRFTEWIQDQGGLPREVLLFCRNVLAYLGRIADQEKYQQLATQIFR